MSAMSNERYRDKTTKLCIPVGSRFFRLRSYVRVKSSFLPFKVYTRLKNVVQTYGDGTFLAYTPSPQSRGAPKCTFLLLCTHPKMSVAIELLLYERLEFHCDLVFSNDFFLKLDNFYKCCN